MAGEFDCPGQADGRFFLTIFLVLPPWKLTYYWWWRNPKQPPNMYETLYIAGYLPYQPWLLPSTVSPKNWWLVQMIHLLWIWFLFGGRICSLFFICGGEGNGKNPGFLKYSKVLQNVMFDSWQDGLLFRRFSVLEMLLSMRNNLIFPSFLPSFGLFTLLTMFFQLFLFQSRVFIGHTPF